MQLVTTSVTTTSTCREEARIRFEKDLFMLLFWNKGMSQVNDKDLSCFEGWVFLVYLLIKLRKKFAWLIFTTILRKVKDHLWITTWEAELGTLSI